MSVINGSKGDWSVRVRTGQAPESITFQYTPRQDANGCPDIRLSQTSKRAAFDAAGNSVDIGDGVQRAGLDNPFEHRKDDEITDTDGTKVSIDHRRCEGDPYVNGGDPEEQPPSKGDATKNPPDPTICNDAPGAAFAVIKPNIEKIVVDFEICAVCAATGENLGCLRWKSIWERVPPLRDEQRVGRIEFDHAQAEQPPSKGFRLAFWRFLINHVKGTADGKTRFVCQEPKAGEDPNRGEVPEPILKRVLAKPEEPAASGGGGGGGGEDGNGGEQPGSDQRQGMRIDPDDEELGTGSRHASLHDAIKAALADPTAAAVKLSWAGTQAPALPSALFCGPLGITPALLTPFIENQPDFASDFVRIATQILDKPKMQHLVPELGKAAKWPGSDGLVTLSLISQVHDPGQAKAFTLRVNGDRIAAAMERMLSLKGQSRAERAIYQYIFLNFRQSALDLQWPEKPSKKRRLVRCLSYLVNTLKRFWEGIVIPVQDAPQAAGLLAPCASQAPLVKPALLAARVLVEALPEGQDLEVPDRDAAIDAARDALRGAAEQVRADGSTTDEVPSNLGDQKTQQERTWRQQRDRSAREELDRPAERRPDGDTQHETIRAAGQTGITHRICTFWSYQPYRSGTQTVDCCVLRNISVQPRAQVRINPRRKLYIQRTGSSQERINQDQFDRLSPNQQARFVLAEPYSVEAHERAHVADYVKLLDGELASLRFLAFVTTQAEFVVNDRRVRDHVQHICDFTFARYTLRDLQQYPHGHSEKVAVRDQRMAIEDGEAAARAAFERADREAREAVDDAVNAETAGGRRRCVHQPEATPHCLRAD